MCVAQTNPERLHNIVHRLIYSPIIIDLLTDIRLDKWLERAIEITDGTFKSLISDIKEAEKKEKKAAILPKANDTLYHENWKGKNLEVQDQNIKTVRIKRSKTSILQPEEISSLLRVPLLKNGATSTGNKNRPTIISINTCAFDSITQIMFCLYADKIHLSNELKDASDEYAKFIQYCFSSGAKITQVYLKRNMLLKNLLPDNVKEIETYTEIDCISFIAEMYQKLASVCNGLKSISVEKTCSTCQPITGFKTFALFDLIGLEVERIEECIYPLQSQYICKQCTHCGTQNRVPKISWYLTWKAEAL